MHIRHLRKGILAALGTAALAAGLLAAAPAGASTVSHATKAVPVASARSASSGYCTRYDFWYGDSGHCVADIQQMLNDQVWRAWYAGYHGTYISVSGWFGPITYRQVRYFQWRYSLGVDGVVGPVTWAALCRSASASDDTTSWYDAGC